MKTSGFMEPKNIVRWNTLGRGVGGAPGTEKLHSSECFHYFFSPTLSLCSLFSIYDVDFIIWFLKRWYFFRKKRKIKPLWMSFFVAGKFMNLLLTHVLISKGNSACIKHSPPLGLFQFYCLQCWSGVDVRRLWHALKCVFKGILQHFSHICRLKPIDQILVFCFQVHA